MAANGRRILRTGALILALALVLTMASSGPDAIARAAPGSALSAALPASMAPMAPLPEATSTLNGSTRAVELWALPGTLDLPGVSVPIWGFADSAAGPALVPGPLIRVNAGETLEVTLHNQLFGQTISLSFPGQDGLIPDLFGVEFGDSVTYTFTPSREGTFLYEAGLTPGGARQVAMGLIGPLVVDPATPVADKEAILVLNEVDPAFSADPLGFSVNDFAPSYWLINGRTYPDTGYLEVYAGTTVHARYLNAGLQPHSIAVLGLSQRVIAADGQPLPFPLGHIAAAIPAGQTLDALAEVPADAAQGTAYTLYEGSLRCSPHGMLAFLSVVPAQGPVVSNVAVSPSRTNGTADVTLSATLTDADLNVAAYEYFVDTLGAAGTGMPGATITAASVVTVDHVIPAATVAALDDGSHTLYIRGQDDGGTWGDPGSALLTVDKTGPTVTEISVSPNPTDGTVDVTLTATATEPTVAGLYSPDESAAESGTVLGGAYSLDGGASWYPMSVSPPNAANVTLSAVLPADTLPGAGNHAIEVQAEDDLGNLGTVGSVTLQVRTGQASTPPDLYFPIVARP